MWAGLIGIGVAWWLISGNAEGNQNQNDDDDNNDNTQTSQPNVIDAAIFGNFPFNIGRYVVRYSEPKTSVEARGAASLQDAINDATSGVRSDSITFVVNSYWISDIAEIDALDHNATPPPVDRSTVKAYEMNDDNTAAVEVSSTQGRSSKMSKVEKPEFDEHDMYDPSTGEAVKVETYEEHLELQEEGYTHEKPEVVEVEKVEIVEPVFAKEAESFEAQQNLKMFNNNDQPFSMKGVGYRG